MSFKKTVTHSLLWRGFYYFTLLLLNIFVSRYFQSGNSGWIFYLTNLFSFILLIVSLSAESGISYFASRNDILPGKLITFILSWVLLIALLTWFFIEDFVKLTSYNIPDRNGDVLFFSMCYIPGILLTTYFTVLFYAQRNYTLPNLLLSLHNIAVIVIIPKRISPGENYSESILHIYFLYFLSAGVSLAVAYIVRNKNDFQISFLTQKEFKLLMHYSLRALFAGILFFLVYRIDYWFVQYFCDKQSLGNYIQASKVGQLLLLAPQIIAATLFPETARTDDSKTHEYIPFLSRILSLLLIMISLFLIIAGSRFFVFVFGPTYNTMYFALLLLLPGILALSILHLLSAYLAGRNNITANMKGSFFSLIIILAGDVLFIPRYGIYAAAMVSSVGYVFHLFYNLQQFSQYYHRPVIDFFIPRKKDIQRLQNILLQKIL